MNRRDMVEGLLLGALAGGAVPASAGLGAGVVHTEKVPGTGQQVVVFDTRFVAARQFAQAAAARGCVAHGIAGDVTPLWHEWLERRWHRHAVAVHGMTTPRSLHCLEQLAADHFWRVASREPAGPLVKWALVPAGLPS